LTDLKHPHKKGDTSICISVYNIIVFRKTAQVLLGYDTKSAVL